MGVEIIKNPTGLSLMSNFLPDCTDFTDIPIMEQLKPFLCPKCKGHGLYNITLNAYGPKKHFQGCCSQCNGWGWVEKENAECIHAWQEMSSGECKTQGILHYGKCWHQYKCSKCGTLTSTDSSD